VTAGTQIGAIIFTPGASSFTITTDPGVFNIAGTGIENDSNAMQNFIANQPYMGLAFHHQATAGTQTVFTVENLSVIVFYDEATAGLGTFTIKGNTAFMDGASAAYFYDGASAGSGIFINGGGTGFDAEGGGTVFRGQSTAANAAFTNMAATDTTSYPSVIVFQEHSTAADSIITNQGGVVASGVGGLTDFVDHATAAFATITCQGAQLAGAYGGIVAFSETASAGSATLVANGGINGGDGGTIRFFDTSDGGQVRVVLFGNGTLDLTDLARPALTIGSLEGDGSVLLDIHNLTVGSNNVTTEFSGIVQDGGINGGMGGSLTKIGAGVFTLSGANLYTGGTTVTEGALGVSNTTGSGTGSGAVQVNTGTLGGSGIISGAVTIGTGSGTGAFLAPAHGTNVQTTLTIQSPLSFNADSTYTCTFKARSNRAKTDKVIADGVTINSGASFAFQGSAQGPLRLGLVLTVISNTSANPIAGTFSNLPDGAILRVNGNNFQASYEGGDGNDLTLAVVP